MYWREYCQTRRAGCHKGIRQTLVGPLNYLFELFTQRPQTVEIGGDLPLIVQLHVQNDFFYLASCYVTSFVFEKVIHLVDMEVLS